MNNAERLRQLVKKQNGTVTTRDLAKHGIARAYLQVLLNAGELIRAARGVYCSPSEWDDDMFNIQYRFSRGIFSHGTALFLHKLTDRAPLYYEMTFPQGYNPTAAKEASVRTKTVKQSVYDLGITKKPTPTGKEVVTYDAERTLCDLVKDSKTDKQIIIPALKMYVARKDKDIPKLMDYAVILKVEEKMRIYLEVLI